MKKLDMQTPDLTSENIAKIAEIFPNVITEKEGKDGALEKAVDFDLLRQALQGELVEGDDERYRLDWPGKRASILKANTPIQKTLRPDRESSVNFDTTQNLFIEGDNFEVLKMLQESYLGKIKMIYIDPPYNTGKDFVYKDNFAQGKVAYEEEIGVEGDEGGKLFRNTDTNGRFHSDWLSMMFERLTIARDLLKDNGVIFVSIDDNEQDNLRKVLDEVFGSQNFIAQFTWRRTDNQPNIGKFAKVKEYIICYCKFEGGFELNKMSLTERAKKEYRYEDDKGKFRRSNLYDKTRGRYIYEINTPSGMTLSGPWMVQEIEFQELQKAGNIYWATGDEETPYGKIYLHESGGQIPNDFLGIEFGTNQEAGIDLELLFNGKRIFDFPKPISLIKHFINIGSKNSDIILDFFSGSATTAHAVMSLNAEDGGNRKFIMVQIPEETPADSEARKAGYETIAEIGKERIHRAGNKILADNKEALKKREAPLDIGFRVLKADSSNMKDVYYHPSELTQGSILGLTDNIKEDRTPEDLLTQVILDLGLELSLPIEEKKIKGNTVYFVQGNALVACFDDSIDFTIVDEIAKIEPLKVVFKDASFKDDKDRINVETRFKRLSPDTAITVL